MKGIWLIVFNFILLIARAQDSSSQRAYGQGAAKYITIGKAKKDEHLTGKIYFKGVRFVDNRLDTSVVGYSINSNSGSVVKVNFKGGLSAVNRYVNANYKNAFTEDKDSLIVIVNEFRMGFATYKYSGVHDYRLVRMKLLLAGKYKDRIALLGTYDTTLVYKREFIHYYVACAKKALKSILVQADHLARREGDLAEKGGLEKGGLEKGGLAEKGDLSEKLTEKQFFARYVPVNRPVYPILRDSCLKKGVYLDFHQFLANVPLDCLPDQGTMAPYFTGKDADYLPEYEEINDVNVWARGDWRANMDSSNIWGYCDGNMVYVNAGSGAGFYPYIRNGNSFTIASRGKMRNPHPQKTIVTVVEIVGFVALIVAIAWLCRNNSSGFSGFSPSGGSGYIPPLPPPKVSVTTGGKTYRLWGDEINMQTGKLKF